MSVHIHVSKIIAASKKELKCPDCKQAAEFVVFSYEWYEPSVICTNCGRRWEGGEWMPLPFARGARQQSIAAALKIYDAVMAREEH